MLVLEAEQDCLPRSRPAGAREESALLDCVYTGHVGAAAASSLDRQPAAGAQPRLRRLRVSGVVVARRARPGLLHGHRLELEAEAEMRMSGDEQVHGPLLPSGDDVPDRPERLDLVASGLGCVLGCQVGREVVERLAVQGELEHAMVAERAELATDPTLLADAVARTHRHWRPERPAVGFRACRFLANDVLGGFTLECVDRVSRTT